MIAPQAFLSPCDDPCPPGGDRFKGPVVLPDESLAWDDGGCGPLVRMHRTPGAWLWAWAFRPALFCLGLLAVAAAFAKGRAS